MLIFDLTKKKGFGQDPTSLDSSAIFDPPTIPPGSSLSALPWRPCSALNTSHHRWALGPVTTGPALDRPGIDRPGPALALPRSPLIRPGSGPPHQTPCASTHGSQLGPVRMVTEQACFLRAIHTLTSAPTRPVPRPPLAEWAQSRPHWPRPSSRSSQHRSARPDWAPAPAGPSHAADVTHACP